MVTASDVYFSTSYRNYFLRNIILFSSSRGLSPNPALRGTHGALVYTTMKVQAPTDYFVQLSGPAKSIYMPGE